MIQFNLLPDVKLQYIKAQRVKRTVITISLLAGVAALALFLFLIVTVKVVQTKMIDSKTKQIAEMSDEIRQTPNLSKMLTVQSQLDRLTELHDNKPVMSRIYDYMNKLTPVTVSVSQLTVEMEAKTMTIDGSADSLEAANAFADALKFTTYTVKDTQAPPTNAFTQVMYNSVNRDSTKASFSITLQFDQAIFSNTQEVNLQVNKSVADQAAAVITKR
jgi:Tfp pilus assembly protein PilN